MSRVVFILNLPWTLVGLLLAAISVPERITIHSSPFALEFQVKSFWWLAWFPAMKNARGTAMGNVVLLGKSVLERDLEHELIHVRQFARAPLIYPVLYLIETVRQGYKNNRYEKEAYEEAQNVYLSESNQ